jgi:glycosyltransferase involved in cell wall biosynthesis
MILMSATRKEDADRVMWREWIKSRIVRQFGAAVVGGSPQRRYAYELGVPENAIFDGYDVVDNDFFTNGAAEARMNPGRSEGLPGLESTTPFFLASGRMIARKDYPTLIEAYRRYRDAMADPWRLVILGDGELRPTIERLIVESALDGVTITGWQSEASLLKYYGSAGAFVHTATVDQWGLVVNEAMAAGLPVIVSNGTGCVEDLVEGRGVGFSFPAGDAHGLARFMQRISEDESLRREMGSRSLQVISSWTPRLFGESMLKAIRVVEQASSRQSPTTRLLIRIVQLTSKELTSFHSVQN